MAYTHNWTHKDANGHVLAGDRIYAVDSTEIRDAADRRLFDDSPACVLPEQRLIVAP